MPQIIYLHGFASSPASRKARFFAERFAEHGTEIRIPDLEENDFHHLSLSRMLSLVASLAASDRVSLIGSSLGGYLAALFAERFPEQVERVVLLAPAFQFATLWADYLGAEQMRDFESQGQLSVPHYGRGGTASIGWQLLQDARQYAGLPNVTASTLIYHGIHDDVVPIRVSREFAALHPQTATLHEMNSGHELTDVLDQMGGPVVDFVLGR